VVGIVVGRLGLTYPGVTTVTWHREGVRAPGNGVSGSRRSLGGLVYSPGVQGLRATRVRALDSRRWRSTTYS
jgi:hypothetical protein